MELIKDNIEPVEQSDTLVDGNVIEEFLIDDYKKLDEKFNHTLESAKDKVKPAAKPEKIKCECGAILAKKSMRNHLKSARHAKKMEIINKITFKYPDKTIPLDTLEKKMSRCEYNKEWRKKKRECECGCIVSNGYYLIHVTTKKHHDLLLKKEEADRDDNIN